VRLDRGNDPLIRLRVVTSCALSILNKKGKTMHYIFSKDLSHLRTREEYRKHSPSTLLWVVFFNARGVFIKVLYMPSMYAALWYRIKAEAKTETERVLETLFLHSAFSFLDSESITNSPQCRKILLKVRQQRLFPSVDILSLFRECTSRIVCFWISMVSPDKPWLFI